MVLLIFVLGALLGVLAGGTLCVHYLRTAITADIGPKLRRMQNQLDNIESAVNLAMVTWYAELSRTPTQPPAIPVPRAHDQGPR